VHFSTGTAVDYEDVLEFGVMDGFIVLTQEGDTVRYINKEKVDIVDTFDAEQV
jgi:hypothetical protein